MRSLLTGAIFIKAHELQRVFGDNVSIFTVLLCFQGLLFNIDWPDASLKSTVLRITCLVLSDISGSQTLPEDPDTGHENDRAKANHGWHCRPGTVMHDNLLFFVPMNKWGTSCWIELGLGFPPAWMDVTPCKCVWSVPLPLFPPRSFFLIWVMGVILGKAVSAIPFVSFITFPQIFIYLFMYNYNYCLCCEMFGFVFVFINTFVYSIRCSVFKYTQNLLQCYSFTWMSSRELSHQIRAPTTKQNRAVITLRQPLSPVGRESGGDEQIRRLLRSVWTAKSLTPRPLFGPSGCVAPV